ncbi:MAG: hypothetical protein JWP63_6620 [Candidatus Solibacter sp.]|nr:hypothetical protein [Candidatus Solibacter sp.]
MGDAARYRDGAIVGEQIAIQRVHGRIVDVRFEHAFTEVVEYDYAASSTQPAARSLV